MVLTNVAGYLRTRIGQVANVIFLCKVDISSISVMSICCQRPEGWIEEIHSLMKETSVSRRVLGNRALLMMNN